MLKLEDIKKDAQIRGIQADEIVRVVQVDPVGNDALTVYYKDSQGRLSEQMLFRSDESRLDLAKAGRPWAFDALGEDFKLGLEAYRINLAHLFDPMMAGPYLQRGTAASPNLSRVRGDAASSATAFCAG